MQNGDQLHRDVGPLLVDAHVEDRDDVRPLFLPATACEIR
jgi:hypothetical protein